MGENSPNLVILVKEWKHLFFLSRPNVAIIGDNDNKMEAREKKSVKAAVKLCYFMPQINKIISHDCLHERERKMLSFLSESHRLVLTEDAYIHTYIHTYIHNVVIGNL
jgi:hypothetical protein